MFWEFFRQEHPGFRVLTNSDGIRKTLPGVPVRMVGFPLAMFTCQIGRRL